MNNEIQNTSPTARMFAYHVNMSRKTQTTIAAHAGYSRPNVVSMFKAGKMPIPIERIPALAEALEIDPKDLIRTALAEYFPAIWRVVQEHFGPGMLVSDDEQQLLEILRKKAGPRGVKIVTERQRQAMRELADSLSLKPSDDQPEAEIKH